jgi:hypothetical protein
MQRVHQTFPHKTWQPHPQPLLLTCRLEFKRASAAACLPRAVLSCAPTPGIAQVPLSKLKDSFNDGTSIAYIEELEQRYKADPSSVDKTWGMFFKAMGGWGRGLF